MFQKFTTKTLPNWEKKFKFELNYKVKIKEFFLILLYAFNVISNHLVNKTQFPLDLPSLHMHYVNSFFPIFNLNYLTHYETLFLD